MRSRAATLVLPAVFLTGVMAACAADLTVSDAQVVVEIQILDVPDAVVASDTLVPRARVIDDQGFEALIPLEWTSVDATQLAVLRPADSLATGTRSRPTGWA